MKKSTETTKNFDDIFVIFGIRNGHTINVDVDDDDDGFLGSLKCDLDPDQFHGNFPSHDR